MLTVSAVFLSSAIGTAMANYAVTTGLDILQIRLSPTLRKVIVLVAAVLAGYLGLVWALSVY